MSYPTNTSASDVWSIRDVYKARAGGNWPEVIIFSATGGTVTDITEGGVDYRVHAFTSSGTFEVTGEGSVDVLVVGGGGGGGNGAGGGGGAGGVIFNQNLSVTAGVFNIDVGQGGVGDTDQDSTAVGGVGESSIAFGLTALGGGGGGFSGGSAADGSDGGSGGGGGYINIGGTGTQPSSIDGGFGNDGGDGGFGNPYPAGGGGGAGSAGGSTSPSVAGDGGEGKDFSSEFGIDFGDGGSFAGGGGGSGYSGVTDGIGKAGGGDGGVNGGNAIQNTGSGGGGARRYSSTAGDGGSGIVLIRYELPEFPAPGAPTTVTATDEDDSESTVSFSGQVTYGISPTFTVTSSPDGITATGSSSPITVTGLTNDTEYTFTVTVDDDGGSATSDPSNAVTPESSSSIVTDIATTSTDTYSVPSGQPNGIFISDNGTKIYVSTQGGAVEEYTLNTVNDLTTITYETSKSLSGLNDGRLRGVMVDTTGTKVFISDYGTNEVTEYSMSAFDLSTLNTTPTRQVDLSALSGASGIGFTEAIIFSRDGLKLYHWSEGSGLLSQFSMSTAFDLTTLAYDNKTLSGSTTARGVVITTNGSQLYISDSGDNLIEYSLSTPFEIDTASTTSNSYQQTELEKNAKYNFSDDMTKLYASNYDGSIHEFDVTTS